MFVERVMVGIPYFHVVVHAVRENVCSAVGVEVLVETISAEGAESFGWL